MWNLQRFLYILNLPIWVAGRPSYMNLSGWTHDWYGPMVRQACHIVPMQTHQRINDQKLHDAYFLFHFYFLITRSINLGRPCKANHRTTCLLIKHRHDELFFLPTLRKALSWRSFVLTPDLIPMSVPMISYSDASGKGALLTTDSKAFLRARHAIPGPSNP